MSDQNVAAGKTAPSLLDAGPSDGQSDDLFDAPPLAAPPPPIPDPEPAADAEEASSPARTAAPVVMAPTVPGATVKMTMTYPQGYGPRIPGVTGGAPAAARHQVDALRFFDGLVDDPNAVNYRLQVRRTKPNIWKGYRLFRTEPLEDLSPPLKIEHLRQMVAETHGGGVFQVKAINPNGQCVRVIEFTIDTASYPPVVPDGSPFVGTLEGRGAALVGPGASLFGGAEAVGGSLRVPPSVEIQSIQQAKQVMEGQIQLRKIEKQMRDQEREFKREEEREREREEAKAMQPVQAQQAQVEAVRTEMRTMFDGLKDLIRVMADGKKDDKSVEVLLKKMETDAQLNMKSMEMQSQQMATMFTALATAMKREDPKPPIDLSMLLQVLSGSNEKMLQVAMQGSSKADRLVEAIITNKLSQPDNHLKMAMDFMERGKRETMEIMELMQGDSAPDVINPEGGFWGNLGNVFVHGLSRLVSGAAAGGGGKLVEALAGMSAKPVAGNVYMPTYEPAALPAPAQPQLPPPAPRTAPAVAANPVPAAPKAAPIPFFDTEMDDESTIEEAHTRASRVSAPVVAPVPVAAPTLVVPSADDELAGHVTEAMEQAIRDLDAGRRDPDWPDYALGKWNNSFLQQLAQASDDSARIQLIGSQCDPAVYQQLVARMRANTTHVVNFVAGLHFLLQEFARGDDVRQPAA